MEYYDKASVSFRQQLGNITQDNIHCIYMFSVMALCINMAMTQCKGLGFDKQQSLLDWASTGFFPDFLLVLLRVDPLRALSALWVAAAALVVVGVRRAQLVA